ncbi:MAG: hypothetical protein IJL87_04480, partial [Clostridia bacterium]|nr:hypothetical protein [Clostridia bacterium]
KVLFAKVDKQAEIGEIAEILVQVTTGADKIQFINSEGQTVTFTRDSAKVKSILPYYISGDSKIWTDGAEVWTINLKVYKPTETYNVKARYGMAWTNAEKIQFTLNGANPYEKKVLSAVVDVPGTIGYYAKLFVTVGGSPAKIQFRDSAGNTFTYTRDNANVTKIEADSTSQTETWTVKQKVYKPTEYYTVAAKYKTGWSGGTVSVTIKELVKSSADITFKIVNHSDDYDYDDRLYITVPAGTKRIVAGNAFEGNTGSGEYTREWVEANDHSGSIYDPGIGNIGNGQEQWDLPNGAIFWLINLGGELSYLSAELEDGSWTVGGYYGWEEHNNYRYVPCLRMAETEPVTEPVEEPVKALNFAQAVSQSEIGGYVYVFVSAGKGASKIQFANSGGNTLTYTRSSSAVNSISQSGDNEIWAISLRVYRPSDTYTVKAKYGKEWITGSGITFTVTAQ